MSCFVCAKQPEKYKCPKCRIKYCSVPCYKIHSEHCKTVVVEQEEVVSKPKTTDKVQNEEEDLQLSAKQLELLGIVLHFVTFLSVESWPELSNWMSKILGQGKESIPIGKLIELIDTSSDPSSMLDSSLENSSVFATFVHEMLTRIGARSGNSSLAPLEVAALANSDLQHQAAQNFLDEDIYLPMTADPLDINYLNQYLEFKASKKAELESMHYK